MHLFLRIRRVFLEAHLGLLGPGNDAGEPEQAEISSATEAQPRVVGFTASPPALELDHPHPFYDGAPHGLGR